MKMKSIIIVIICFVYVNLSYALSWQEILEQNFDIADTFDHYDNWTGNALDGKGIWYLDNSAAAPVYTDGTGASPYWRGHAYYKRSGGTRPVVIGDHGSEKQVGTKGCRLSYGGQGTEVTNGEIGGLKTYFGTGSETSGYSDVYIFFRMYMSATAIPTYNYNDTTHSTACFDYVDGLTRPCYVAGKDYAVCDSWKWVAVNMGFINEKQFMNEAIVDNPCRWGLNEIHFHIKGGATQNYERRIRLSVAATDFVSKYGDIDISPWFDKLIGVEIHLKRESGKKTGDGQASVWFYDTDGTSTKVFDAPGINLVEDENDYSGSSCWGKHGSTITQAKANNLKFNRINFEANKRVKGAKGTDGNNYAGGVIKNSSGTIIGDMETDWYIDDFIVDNNRIGPVYYSILPDSSQPGTVSSPPTNVIITN